MREAHVRLAGARGYPEEGAIHSFWQIIGFCIKTRLNSRSYLLVSSNHIIADNEKAFVLDLLSVTVPRSNNSIDKTLAKAEVNFSVNMQ
jgi:hypothetical protein